MDAVSLMFTFLIIFQFVIINYEYDTLTQQSRTFRTRAESERCSKNQLRSWCWCGRIRLDNNVPPSDTNIGLTFLHIPREEVVSLPPLEKISSHPKYPPAASPRLTSRWEGFPGTAWRLNIDIRIKALDRLVFKKRVWYLLKQFPRHTSIC